MAILIGITLATVVSGFARWIGLDRDRAFYPTLMLAISSYYVLFAAMIGSAVLPIEIGLCVVFVAVALFGFKRSLWFVVAALIGHGVFDLIHPHALHGSGAPLWWPDFCSAYDVTAGVFLSVLLLRSKRTGTHEPAPSRTSSANG